eukprot:1390998-Amorphochlora_amoeboformis.AAC.1
MLHPKTERERRRCKGKEGEKETHELLERVEENKEGARECKRDRIMETTSPNIRTSQEEDIHGDQ